MFSIYYHDWTEDDELRLISVRAEGKSFGAIAKLLGMRYAQVSGKYYTILRRSNKEIPPKGTEVKEGL